MFYNNNTQSSTFYNMFHNTNTQSPMVLRPTTETHSLFEQYLLPAATYIEEEFPSERGKFLCVAFLQLMVLVQLELREERCLSAHTTTRLLCL